MGTNEVVGYQSILLKEVAIKIDKICDDFHNDLNFRYDFEEWLDKLNSIRREMFYD
jgi:hypothetical protein